MDKRDLFDALEQFSEELMVTLAEVESIKKHLREVVEENTQLRLENEKLRERLGEVEERAPVHKERQGRSNLEKIYLDGFHICTFSYGQRRENDEECVFCDELLYR